MLLAEIILAFLIGLLLAIVMVAVFRWQKPGAKGYWSTLLFLFALLFVASWAGGLWISNFGPVGWGIRWLPFVVAGVVISILLLVLIPQRRPRTTEEAERQATLQTGMPGVVNVILWILIVALAISIVAYYLL